MSNPDPDLRTHKKMREAISNRRKRVTTHPRKLRRQLRAQERLQK